MTDFHTPAGGGSREHKTIALDRYHLLNLKPLADGLVIGGPAIAKLLFNSESKETVRATYHLLESSTSVPSLKFGGRWAVRTSTVSAKWWLQERMAFQEQDEELLAKIHILLSSILPMLVEVCNASLDVKEAIQLAHGVDEVTIMIEQLLRVKRA